jgi:long-chain acyl-CoA synthetase
MSDDTVLPHAWRSRVAARPDGVAVRYFDGALTAAELDAESDALASALQELGVRRGDRVGVRLQNVPHFVVSMLAVWKAGAAVLLLNPMYQHRELRHLLEDSGACGLVVDEHDVRRSLDAAAGTAVRWALASSARAHQTRDDPRVLTATEPVADPVADPVTDPGAVDLDALVARHAGAVPEPVEVRPEDLALLTYTSGTTGPPKGAENTHANVLAAARGYADWVDLGPDDVVLAVAPLFHITGAVINATMALLEGATLVLAHRFHPEVVLDAIVEHGVTFTIGSITAFNALAASPRADRQAFASVRCLYSGGAPVPPATVERFEERFGPYIHPVYGMTETTSAVVAAPLGERAPVHAPSGTLSAGKAMPGVELRVLDPDGNPLPAGEQGELEIRGASVVPGYWRNPEATERTMPGGRLRTGDGAVIDQEGWVYLVDRLKDQINVSGYKVWPREVEDALYEHPSVHEAAVVGRSDAYRGEEVVAFVSLEAGASTGAGELVAFVRERLAAFKCPREIFLVPELPKTQTGKIRRAELRDRLHDAG